MKLTGETGERAAALADRMREDWVCPRCRGELATAEAEVTCTNCRCARSYPMIDNVPILINEERSLFRIADFVSRIATTFDWERLAGRRSARGPLHALRRAVVDHAPTLALIIGDFLPEDALAAIIRERPAARILVIGCGDRLFHAPAGVRFVYGDVSLGPITQMVFDATDIPFRDETFDAVLSLAVIPYVADPWRCAAEIRRVLKPSGLVYDISAFMQQVHMGRYDFTRFTYMGHRRLFAGFDAVQRGVMCGPGMALCWSLSYFFESFFENHTARMVVRLAARYALFWIKYWDRLLVRRRGTYDAASGFFFFGRKGERVLSDREILDSHIGLRPL